MRKNDELMEKLGKPRTKTYNIGKRREVTSNLSNNSKEYNP